jgi:3-hydroxyacyl-CoA dehydrogenase/enoyl-CoA hydratase/3-hydroxybutyryl-CoA epimerase
MQNYKHWRLETDSDKILWLYFDKQNATVNTLEHEAMSELSAIVDGLKNDTNHKGLIIASGKKTGFIAGADISQFTRFPGVDEATQILRSGQRIFDKLEALKMPSVAMIDGFCVGGGLELALACHYRVAEDGPKTRLGLPEVTLGIHPGWGGTVRLPRLIGGLNGMDLILSGRSVSGKAAAKYGFVDAAVPKRHLEKAAKYYVMHQPKLHKATWLQELTNNVLARKVIAKFMRSKMRAKVNQEHYPSPYVALDNWEEVSVYHEQAYEREAQTCAKMFMTDTCHNLVRDFFLQERLKGLAKESHFNPQRVHVIGAGTMGGDIAAWCAMKGMTVTLQDREPKYIAPAIKRAHDLFKQKLKETHLVQKAMDRLIPDVNGYGVHNADVIIEAIYEDLAAKQALFKTLENQVKPNAILATNTSSIPLDEISSVLQMPERLVGIHFFNPVAKMQLVEVVKGQKTDSLVIDKAIGFVRKIDRLPLPVKSSPGFLVNRILMPYLLEAVLMIDEGVPPSIIDKAMLKFGMPMGPVTLADTVGLDICLSVAKYLGKYMNTPVPQRLIDMVAQGKLGRKSGEGFYLYKKGRQIRPSGVVYDKPLDDISDRLVLRMLDEAFACLREGVVEDADLLDAGMIFGTGFAPFRGGPIHYAKAKGIAALYQQYVKQRAALGEKTAESRSWQDTVVS